MHDAITLDNVIPWGAYRWRFDDKPFPRALVADCEKLKFNRILFFKFTAVDVIHGSYSKGRRDRILNIKSIFIVAVSARGRLNKKIMFFKSCVASHQVDMNKLVYSWTCRLVVKILLNLFFDLFNR